MGDCVECLAEIQYCHVYLGSRVEKVVVRNCVSKEKTALKPWLRCVGMLCFSSNSR